MTNHTDQERVLGVFLDEGTAQRAVQALQSSGFEAQIADQNSIRNLSNLIGIEQSRVYESRFSEGNTVVIVNSGDRGEEALNLMLQNGAEYINLHEQADRSARLQGQAYDADYYQNLQGNQRQYGQYDQNLGRARNEDEIRVQLREEELVPEKRAQEAGQVEVRKTVREEEQEIPVTLRHEEVTVDRRAVDRPLQEGEATDLRDEVIRVPVYQEQAELRKEGRVAEEVVIDKDVVEEQQTLRGTTRKEDIDIESAGQVRRSDADVDVRTTDRQDTTNP